MKGKNSMDSQKNQDFPAATRPHILLMDHPAVQTPSKALPDGAITGNGDLTAILAGAADRVHIYIGKADFWNADCRAYAEHRGGLAPVGLAELLLPHLAYAAYHVEQDLDHARITLRLNEGKLWAELKIIVCATENTVLLELKHAHPMTSSSLSLLPLTDSDAIAECGSEGDVLFSLRGFDGTACRFASYGVCAMRQIERSISKGTERILWAISVCTNHDSARVINNCFRRTVRTGNNSGQNPAFHCRMKTLKRAGMLGFTLLLAARETKNSHQGCGAFIPLQTGWAGIAIII